MTAVSSVAADYPRITLDNALLSASIYLPDPARGYCRGTRFDWSGIVERAACPEPFSRIHLRPGEVRHWSSRYRFEVDAPD